MDCQCSNSDAGPDRPSRTFNLFPKFRTLHCQCHSGWRQFCSLTNFPNLEARGPTLINSCKLAGEYSCLTVDLTFKREFSYYLLTIYVPCCMLVIVSWVSFWLDPNAVPARVSLGVTTLLTMSTQQVRDCPWHAPLSSQCSKAKCYLWITRNVFLSFYSRALECESIIIVG